MNPRFLIPSALVLLSLAASAAERANIAQITQTKWNQREPYNALCKDANGNLSASGCVPTAMAQVMKVHAWPTEGRGSHTDKYQENLTANFGATTYNWSKMYNEYSKNIFGSWRQDPASVQTLILHAGISVDVIYKGSAGSSYAVDAPYALGEYFRYDKSSIQYIERAYCSPEEWEDIIYASLASGEPVIYSGHNTNEGHTFICDGYQNGKFIFNLGWGNQTSDGSTLVSSFDDLTWPDQQSAIIGIRPDRTPDASTEWREPRLWAVNTTVFYNGGSVEVSGQTTYGTDGVFVKGPGSFPEHSRIGLKFLPFEGGEPIYFYNEFGGDNNPRGMSGFKTSFDKSKLSGKYRVTLCYSYGPDGDWKPIRIEKSKTQGWTYDADSSRSPWVTDPTYSLPGLMHEDEYLTESYNESKPDPEPDPEPDPDPDPNPEPDPTEVGFTMLGYELNNTYGTNYQLRVEWQGGEKLSTPTLILKIYTHDGTDTGYEKKDMGYIPAGSKGVSLFDINGMQDGYYYGIIYIPDADGNLQPITHDLPMTIGMPTGIDEIHSSTPLMWYDLSGRPVGTDPTLLPPGLYLSGSRKLLK